MNNASLLTADRKTHLKDCCGVTGVCHAYRRYRRCEQVDLEPAGRADRDDGRQGCQAGDGRYRREPHHPLRAAGSRAASHLSYSSNCDSGGAGSRGVPDVVSTGIPIERIRATGRSFLGGSALAQASRAQAGLPLRGSPVTTRPRPPPSKKTPPDAPQFLIAYGAPSRCANGSRRERQDAAPPDAVQPGAPRARRWQEPYWPRSYPDPPTGTDQVPAAETAMRFPLLLAALNDLSPGRLPAQALRLSTPA